MNFRNPPSPNQNAIEYDLKGQEYFQYGRYGNNKISPQTNRGTYRQTNDVNNNLARNMNLKDADDEASRNQSQQYIPLQDNSNHVQNSPYTDKEVISQIQVTNNCNANSNNNSNVTIEERVIGLNQLVTDQPGQEAEPVPPPRKKSGYHRSNVHSSPAALLKPNVQVQKNSKNPDPSGIVSSQDNMKILAQSQKQEDVLLSRDHRPPHQQAHVLYYLTQDRNDSGIDLDPESPGSSSAMSLRSTNNGEHAG